MRVKHEPRLRHAEKFCQQVIEPTLEHGSKFDDSTGECVLVKQFFKLRLAHKNT